MSFFEFPHTRTYDSDLGWIIKDVKTADDVIKNILAWIEQTRPDIDDFHNMYEQIMAGNLPQGMIDGINAWMYDHALDIVGEMVKHVYFGLNDAGYFVASIPKQWKELQFKTTGWDYETDIQPEYGHLCILY